MKAADVMLQHPPTCPPTAVLRDAARLLEERHATAVTIVDPTTNQPVGLLSHDCIIRALADGVSPEETPVAQYMDSTVDTVRASDNLRSLAFSAVKEPCERPLVVVDERDQVVGLIERPSNAIATAENTEGEQSAPDSFRTEAMELVWICTNCGFLLQRREALLPDRCPRCGKPKEFFVLRTED